MSQKRKNSNNRSSYLAVFLFFIIILFQKNMTESKLQSSKQKVNINSRKKISNSLQNSSLGQSKKKIKINADSKKELFIDSYDDIPFLPEIQLTEKDMLGDPIPLLINYQKLYKQFGAVKLTCAKPWNPPFCFKYTDKGITTRIQKIHKLRKGKAFQEMEGAYNVKSFQEFAHRFQKQYSYKFDQQGTTKQSVLQNEYWKLVAGSGLKSSTPNKYKAQVEYAADLPVSKHGSGFPTFESKNSQDKTFNYKDSFFNLNNLYKSPSSILKISDQKRQFISGFTTPWVYMGMLFSSFCWHVQDLWLNSVNYSHKGAIKTWYVIPQADKQQFDQYVFKKTGKSQILDRITFMLDPLQVLKSGIKVFKTYQRPGDYICTFVKAYHCGFSQGFNVGQAVNFLYPGIVKVIKEAQQFYQQNQQKKVSVLSLEWLVHQNCKQGGSTQLTKQFQEILQSELNYLKYVVSKFQIKQIVELDDKFKYDKNSCSSCKNYLYLSSLRCKLCQKNYCQKHLDNCCGKGFSLLIRTPYGKRKNNIDKILSLIQL